MPGFYLTTAIDYSNGDPHIGHAIEKIGADVIARYRRACGDDVHFLIGMDEHGQKVQQEAEKHGREPRAWVDEIAAAFVEVWARLGLSNDDFIRTSEPRHHRGARALMERIAASGDLYRSKYEGHYCSGCEAFKKAEELSDGRCPLHPGRTVEWTEEENWFFRLSRYRDALLERLEADPGWVRPRARRNEIRSLLEGGLDDISASRSRIRWGVPFPGDEEHTVYVWFDALSNYITAIGYPDGEGFEGRWPANLHVIGKDITRFHCVYWPAMLMAAGVEPARAVWGHGFIKIGGAKLSKSAGTELGLHELIERHGPDALRYFLMREIPWDGDRDYPSAEDFIRQLDRRYTADLANDLGNLLNRVVSMVSKYRDGAIPPAGRGSSAAGGGAVAAGGDDVAAHDGNAVGGGDDAAAHDGTVAAGGDAAANGGHGRAESRGDLADQVTAALAEHRTHMDAYLLHRGLETALDLVRAANGFVDATQPWAFAKAERGGAGPEALDAVLSQLVRALGAVAAMLAPFMPGKAAELWQALGGEGEPPHWATLDDALAGLERVRPGAVLFPRPDTA